MVIPCSVKTFSAIAHSYNSNLLIRAADVTLKERRKLVLVVRETPFNLSHLRSLTALTEAGAVILPPCPAFYHNPVTIDEYQHFVADDGYRDDRWWQPGGRSWRNVPRAAGPGR